MRTRLLIVPLLLLAALFSAHTSRASHMLGGGLTYTALGNNQYRVFLTVYRDCSGITIPTSATLYYRNTGCSSPGTTAVMTLVPGSTAIGSDYCATNTGGPSPCGPGLPTNYERASYESGVLTLPPAAEWTFSVSINARPDIANLLYASSNDLYYEATLRNSVGGQVIQNSSATFATKPAQFVGWNLPTTFSHLAQDTDGDSLVYSLVAPLSGCNTPMSYSTYPSGGFLSLPDSAGNPCAARMPTGGGQYSPTFPLASFAVRGSCPLKTATPSFIFDPATGAMSFTPASYFRNSSQQWENKYAVVVKVDEYRRIAGTYTLVGSTRREMVFIVVDCGPNQNPTLAPIRNNGTNTTAPVTSVIPVTAGQLVSLQLRGADANNTQLLTMTSNAEQLLTGADFVVTGNNTTQPTAAFNWIPSTSLRPGLYYCTVTVQDNACPIRGTVQQTLAFRVTNTTLATKAAQKATQLTAAPTPFSSEVRFQLAKPGVQAVFVFDQLGRQVAELRSQPSGAVVWQPGTGVAAGLYLARTADGRQVARLLRAE